MQFKDKIIAVTGAGRGIGQEIARAFAAEGARVVLISRSESSCGSAAEEINKAFPGSCTAYAVDVASHDAVQELAKKIGEEIGAVNVLVNNAGVTRDGLLMRMKEEDWERLKNRRKKVDESIDPDFARKNKKINLFKQNSVSLSLSNLPEYFKQLINLGIAME
jgi:3-oxoacyl-[acyl-carrier protein] reductase